MAILPMLTIKDTNEVEYADDLKVHIEKIVDHIQELEKILNDVLTNLSSDNVTEIDFGRTRLYNLNQILDSYATQTWVTTNFVHK